MVQDVDIEVKACSVGSVVQDVSSEVENMSCR